MLIVCFIAALTDSMNQDEKLKFFNFTRTTVSKEMAPQPTTAVDNQHPTPDIIPDGDSKNEVQLFSFHMSPNHKASTVDFSHSNFMCTLIYVERCMYSSRWQVLARRLTA